MRPLCEAQEALVPDNSAVKVEQRAVTGSTRSVPRRCSPWSAIRVVDRSSGGPNNGRGSGTDDSCRSGRDGDGRHGSAPYDLLPWLLPWPFPLPLLPTCTMSFGLVSCGKIEPGSATAVLTTPK